MSKTVFLDGTTCVTDLCLLGKKFKTDKSPFNPGGDTLQARKGFTAFYSMIFAGLRNQAINFCEIGIEDGGSIQMWEKYFTRANLFALELDPNKIEKSKKSTTKTTFCETDVDSEQRLTQTFVDTGVEFDIIIDDSSHHRPHQLNIIRTAPKFLKSGGILIIEDIYRNDPEDIFDSAIDKNDFVLNMFITCHHDNRSGHDNDKIWYAVKK
jgi:SAM-dependent methyltransferase